jgi:hypothetical protein
VRDPGHRRPAATAVVPAGGSLGGHLGIAARPEPDRRVPSSR